MKRLYFRETQKFKQLWLWILLSALAGIWIWGIVQQIFLGIPFGNNPASDLGLILIGLIVISPIILIFKLTLITEVRKDAVYYKFPPLQFKFKKIEPGDIEEYFTRQYKPLSEYGGWGIRIGRKGKAFNVSGNMGMQFILKNGKKLLIGTKKPEEFQKAMDKMIGK
ncbi:MAG: hypothetical protein KAT33_06775 [Bacteroidales bacterium]|nr:hypothetical protein [Bacteroidales bacterium]